MIRGGGRSLKDTERRVMTCSTEEGEEWHKENEAGELKAMRRKKEETVGHEDTEQVRMTIDGGRSITVAVV